MGKEKSNKQLNIWHVDAVLMFLRHRVIEEQRQEKHRADGGIARVIDNTAVFSRLFRNLNSFWHQRPADFERI